jgi:transaldolase
VANAVVLGPAIEIPSRFYFLINDWSINGDSAVAAKVPEPLKNQLGIAIARRIYKAYRTLLGSPRWQRVYNAGARPQRLLWASTGTKDPKASDTLYIEALASPLTVNTMPEGTLKAFAEPLQFKRQVDAFIRRLHGSALLPGFDRIRLPGEDRHQRQQD